MGYSELIRWPTIGLALALGWGAHGVAQGIEPAGVAEVLEDKPADLLKVLTNPTGDPGEGHVEEGQVFSGRQAIRIVPMQRFNSRIPGWAFPIREHPKAGEYRYLRFAWKASGGTGIMLQLHDEKDWRIRFTAGRDMYNWGTKFVAESPPQQWTVVTRDLFAENGAVTISGIALTNFDAKAAYFDHIYFARSIAELDRIDATGFREKGLPELSRTEMDTLWVELGGGDEGLAYQAFWRLVAAKQQGVALVREKLTKGSGVTRAQLEAWIKDLDDERYARREAAMRALTLHAELARPMLERLAEQKPSEEVRWRVAALLAKPIASGQEQRRERNARRVLEYVGTEEAKAVLNELVPLR